MFARIGSHWLAVGAGKAECLFDCKQSTTISQQATLSLSLSHIHTHTANKLFIIAYHCCWPPVLPSSRLQVVGLKNRYSLGDQVELQCSSDFSRPAAALSWFVNGQRVSIHVRQWRGFSFISSVLSSEWRPRLALGARAPEPSQFRLGPAADPLYRHFIGQLQLLCTRLLTVFLCPLQTRARAPRSANRPTGSSWK